MDNKKLLEMDLNKKTLELMDPYTATRIQETLAKKETNDHIWEENYNYLKFYDDNDSLVVIVV